MCAFQELLHQSKQTPAGVADLRNGRTDALPLQLLETRHPRLDQPFGTAQTLRSFEKVQILKRCSRVFVYGMNRKQSPNLEAVHNPREYTFCDAQSNRDSYSAHRYYYLLPEFVLVFVTNPHSVNTLRTKRRNELCVLPFAVPVAPGTYR